MPHPLREIRSGKFGGKRSVDRPPLPERSRNPDRHEELESFISFAIERLERNRQFQDISEGGADVPGFLRRGFHWRRFSPGFHYFSEGTGETAVDRIQDGTELYRFILKQDLEFNLVDIFNGQLVQVEAEKDFINAETIIETGQDDMSGAMHRAESGGRNDLPR